MISHLHILYLDTIKEQLTGCKDAHFMLVDGMSKLMTHKVEMFDSSVFHVSIWPEMVSHTIWCRNTVFAISFNLTIYLFICESQIKSLYLLTGKLNAESHSA